MASQRWRLFVDESGDFDDPDSDPIWADDWWIYFLKERNGTKNVYSIYPEILRHIEPER